jgi:hypothetical protein
LKDLNIFFIECNKLIFNYAFIDKLKPQALVELSRSTRQARKDILEMLG